MHCTPVVSIRNAADPSKKARDNMLKADIEALTDMA